MTNHMSEIIKKAIYYSYVLYTVCLFDVVIIYSKGTFRIIFNIFTTRLRSVLYFNQTWCISWRKSARIYPCNACFIYRRL